VIALHDRVAARPRLTAYLVSERRSPFNQQGIFRHYPELDDGCDVRGMRQQGILKKLPAFVDPRRL
jgi:glutathione S-transferase